MSGTKENVHKGPLIECDEERQLSETRSQIKTDRQRERKTERGGEREREMRVERQRKYEEAG